MNTSDIKRVVQRRNTRLRRAAAVQRERTARRLPSNVLCGQLGDAPADLIRDVQRVLDLNR